MPHLAQHDNVLGDAEARDKPRRPRVLVVDDDTRSRDAVARLLSDEGYEAAVASDGEEATLLLPSWRPDLVLTDLNMPRLDGRGLLQRVARLLPGTPVIVVSARLTPEGGASLEALGARGSFRKPVPVDELLNRIHDLIGS
jgi:chemosensory pili system protein ChpA (sensor histidine kinase/response regulator)